MFPWEIQKSNLAINPIDWWFTIPYVKEKPKRKFIVFILLFNSWGHINSIFNQETTPMDGVHLSKKFEGIKLNISAASKIIVTFFHHVVE